MSIMSEGGIVTVLGILVVFVCLILIILVINILSWILKDRRKKPETATEKKIEKDIHEPLPAVPVVDVQDDELIAVLSAAVAAYMEGEAPTGLQVRSYRSGGGRSAWAQAGRSAQIFNSYRG